MIRLDENVSMLGKFLSRTTFEFFEFLFNLEIDVHSTGKFFNYEQQIQVAGLGTHSGSNPAWGEIYMVS